MTNTLSIETLNRLDRDAFTAFLGGVFEHSPWVAERAWRERPFASVGSLHADMVRVVEQAGADRQKALLCAHPELALRGPLTAASAAEQRGLGLDALGGAEAALLAERNRLYRDRFGIPFIIAVRGQKNPAAILEAMAQRLSSNVDTELKTALGEVAKIARFRLEDLVSGDQALKTARLTVHALDTASGQPAAGLKLSLARLDGENRAPLGEWVTNADGRCDQPLLAGDALQTGDYEITFQVGAWQSRPGFYDTIPIRFRITDPSTHYHIPLLLAPFGYSTYRGS